MVELPMWWLVLSGICFGMSILLNAALIAGGIIAWGKINPLLTEVKDQVHTIGEKGSQIASTAKRTMDTVHDRTEQILGSAQEASGRVTQKVGAASAAITTVFVVMRIVGFARGLMARDQKPARRNPRQIPGAYAK